MSKQLNNRSSRYAQSKRAFNANHGRPGRQNQKSRKPKKEYIHPSKFIQQAKPTVQEEYVPIHSFSDFAVAPLLSANIAKMGFTKPSPIQDQSIPEGLNGNDIVGIANTGTGKTASFAIPMLHRLITEPKSKAIILAPTRELAEQIEEQCRKIGKGSGLFGALLIGGKAIGPQLRDLQAKPRVIIGTPGRVKDHLDRGSLKLDDCNIIVLDEVDRMLDMGFVHDITEILSNASPERQSFYFSATLDARVKGIISNFSKDPVFISVKSTETSCNVDQNIVRCTIGEDKLDKLHDILQADIAVKTIIFDDTQRSVERLAKDLAMRGFSSDSIHGGKNQSQRNRVLNKFKNSEIDVLVATDVAARGLDVSDITHVINYSQPQSYSDYVHRIGRTGRAGKVGYALTFVDR